MRLALYLGLFAGAGSAFFTAWTGREATTPASQTIIRIAIWIGIIAVHPWHEGRTTSFGLTAVTAIVALLCAWITLRSNAKPLALVGLAGAGLALALSGHGSAASPQWLTPPSVFVHGMAVAYWVGALRRGPNQTTDIID